MTTEDELRAADIAAWNRDLKRAQDDYYSRPTSACSRAECDDLGDPTCKKHTNDNRRDNARRKETT